MQEKIILNVTKGDLLNATGFVTNEGCLLATACKRHFGTEDVRENLNHVEIDDVVFNHPYFGYANYLAVKNVASEIADTDLDAVIHTLVLTPDSI